MAVEYWVTLQVRSTEGDPAPTGPIVSGVMRVSDPDNRRAFVTEFGWLGHDLLTELKRQWQIASTFSEASASPLVPSGT